MLLAQRLPWLGAASGEMKHQTQSAQVVSKG
jgi:hypothetical protein